MSTPRTIKASEVVKGMRVRVSKDSHGVTTTAEGEVIQGWSRTNRCFIFADGSHKFLGSDHPVTVLSDPEPEWVEGAWYWVEANVNGSRDRTPMRRVEGGWSRWEDLDSTFFFDGDVTVLGRVLIVDWPGDDVARDLDETYPRQRCDIPADVAPLTSVLSKVADAIRTQGGVR